MRPPSPSASPRRSSRQRRERHVPTTLIERADESVVDDKAMLSEQQRIPERPGRQVGDVARIELSRKAGCVQARRQGTFRASQRPSRSRPAGPPSTRRAIAVMLWAPPVAVGSMVTPSCRCASVKRRPLVKLIRATPAAASSSVTLVSVGWPSLARTRGRSRPVGQRRTSGDGNGRAALTRAHRRGRVALEDLARAEALIPCPLQVLQINVFSQTDDAGPGRRRERRFGHRIDTPAGACLPPVGFSPPSARFRARPRHPLMRPATPAPGAQDPARATKPNEITSASQGSSTRAPP